MNKEKYKEVVVLTNYWSDDEEMYLYDYYEDVSVDVLKDRVMVIDNNKNVNITYPIDDVRGVIGR